jgi:hypothetical protein
MKPVRTFLVGVALGLARVRRVLLALSLFACALAAPVEALERRPGIMEGETGDEWNVGTTCTVQYFNICTGWIWCWESSNGERVGTVFEGCDATRETNHLVSTSSYFCSAIPCGRGFTGSIAVYAADANDCPSGPPISKRPFCFSGGWHTTTWNLDVPFKFLVIHEADPLITVDAPATDRPTAGPTGPAACGTCFPSDRTTRSFQFGTAASPLCPGEPFDDGICSAELLIMAAFTSTVHADDSSWGKIKTLFK